LSVPEWIRNDCNAIVEYNISYCYDQSGTSRDWCLANFAYYYNDTSLCREATNEDNCLYTIGYWFKDEYYCNQISDESRRDQCINSYVSFCQSNFYNCYPEEYCSLIDDNDNCIFDYVQGFYYFEEETWD
jgi:hypothetical protein